MRLLKIIIITVLLAVPVLGTANYAYNKTIGYDKTDCMIQYVQKHYPYGSIYHIDGIYPHIDERGIGNEFMPETKEIYGCWFDDSLTSFLYNTPYCYITLLLENAF